MRKIFLLLTLTLLAGCVSVSPETGLSSATSKPLMQMHRIKPGMSMPEVRAVLGDRLVTGYSQKDGNPAQFEAVVIPQPYRQEEFAKDEDTYTVLYYNAFVAKPDGLIAEDELMPYIFEDGVLLSSGLDALDQVKRR